MSVLMLLLLSLSSRVAWTFGPPVCGPIEDITPTYLTRGVLETVRECDHLANQVLSSNSKYFHLEDAQSSWLVVQVLNSRCTERS